MYQLSLHALLKQQIIVQLFSDEKLIKLLVICITKICDRNLLILSRCAAVAPIEGYDGLYVGVPNTYKLAYVWRQCGYLFEVTETESSEVYVQARILMP